MNFHAEAVEVLFSEQARFVETVVEIYIGYWKQDVVSRLSYAISNFRLLVLGPSMAVKMVRHVLLQCSATQVVAKICVTGHRLRRQSAELLQPAPCPPRPDRSKAFHLVDRDERASVRSYGVGSVFIALSRDSSFWRADVTSEQAPRALLIAASRVLVTGPVIFDA